MSILADRIETLIQATPRLTTFDIAVILRTSDSRVKEYMASARARPFIEHGLVATHDYREMKQPAWFENLSNDIKNKVPRKRTEKFASEIALPDDLDYITEEDREKLLLKLEIVKKITARGNGACKQAIRQQAGNHLSRILLKETMDSYEENKPTRKSHLAVRRILVAEGVNV